MRNLFIALSICFSTLIGAVNSATYEKEAQVMDQSTPQYLYRIVSPEAWQKSQRQPYLEISSEFDEKFIHLATKEQLRNIAQKFWNNKEYVILTLDTKKLIGRLTFETNPGGTTFYYHLYEGKIPLEAVLDASNAQDKP